jgi:hypothetical protein
MSIPDPTTPPEDTPEPFGSHTPGSFGADVRYEGDVDGHHYLLEVRHRLLDTSLEIVLDGVRHVPADRGEKKQAKASDASAVTTDDGVALRLEDGVTRQRCTVRRPTTTGEMKDREVIEVRTAGLGGAGEADVRRAATSAGVALAPEDGSPSARRDARKLAHPVRSGLLAAAAAAAKVLVPLLGIGALIRLLLGGVGRWADERTRPVREWFGDLVDPVLTWLGDVLRPLFAAWDRLMGFLFGWIPDLSLPFSLPHLPDWVFDVAKPVILIVIAFVATYGGIRRRRRQLAGREGGDPHDAQGTERHDAPDEDPASGPSGPEVTGR